MSSICQLSIQLSLTKVKILFMHHAPFPPLHHILQARCKVYFILLKEVSYDSLWKSWAFQPTRLQHTNTPRLLLLYTIVPINKWNSFTSLAVSTSSLVQICTTSLYHNALGYVIGTSRNQANECALMAVLPKVNYLDIPSFAENERDCNPPPKKQSKIESPSPHPQLFDPTHICICRPQQAISQPHNLYATLYNNGFHCFFKDKFLDIMSNGESRSWHCGKWVVEFNVASNEHGDHPQDTPCLSLLWSFLLPWHADFTNLSMVLTYN